MLIKELRQAANKTQQELADELGIDRSTITCWEIGTSKPRAEMLPKLADALNCSIDAIFGRTPATNKN